MTWDLAEETFRTPRPVDQLRCSDFLDAIREHRASHTPKDWSDADRRLYEQLPEVDGGD